eukprot:3191622-Rhodomonas_salina.2
MKCLGTRKTQERRAQGTESLTCEQGSPPKLAMADSEWRKRCRRRERGEEGRRVWKPAPVGLSGFPKA